MGNGSEIETKVLVRAKPEGFDKVQQQTTKLNQTQKAIFNDQEAGLKRSAQSSENYRKAVRTLDKELEKLNKTHEALKEQLNGVKEGGAIYKQLAESIAKAEAEADKLHQAQSVARRGLEEEGRIANRLKADIKAMNAEKRQAAQEEAKRQAQAKRDAERRSGAFGQGFAQGSGMGEYIERGPGMYRQIAGRALGRALVGAPMQAGMGMASMPFTGIGGLTQMLNAIPVVGGFAAGSLSNAAGFAGGALGYNRSRMQASSILRDVNPSRGDMTHASGLGADVNELLSNRATIAGIAGGGSDQGLGGIGLTLNRAYGVDAATTGMFARGGRNFAFGNQSSGDALMGSIGDAKRAGLDDSEIPDYLEVIAEGIAQFEASGIPINPQSFGGLARAIAETGVSGRVALNQARGVQSANQAIGANGPSNMVDLIKLQIKGYTGSGGAENFLNAQKGVEGNWGAEDQAKLNQRLAELSGPGALGSMVFKRLGGQAGYQLSATSSDRMLRSIRGELTDDEKWDAADAASRQKGPNGTSEEEYAIATQRANKAMANAPGVGRQASISNTQIGVGQTMIPITQDLESMTTESAKAMSNFAPIIKGITGTMEDFSKQLPSYTTRAMKSIDHFGDALEILTGRVTTLNESLKNSPGPINKKNPVRAAPSHTR